MKFLITILFTLMSLEIMADYKSLPQNLRLPTQQLLEKFIITSPQSGVNLNILTVVNGDTNGTGKIISSFAEQPNHARVLRVSPGGVTASVKAGNVIINGLDIRSNVITDIFYFNDDQSDSIEGTRAFAIVTSVIFPSEDSPYDATWSIDGTDKLGLYHCLDNSALLFKHLTGNASTTSENTSVDDDEVSKNYTDISDPAPDGANSYCLFYIQNFNCAQG